MLRSRLAYIVIASVISACGGGGGGGGGSAGGGSPPVDPGSSAGTGLVPAAPLTGASLYANAADLRPLIDGASWQYRGVAKDADGRTATRYIASIGHKLIGGSLQETERQVFTESTDTSAIALSGGSIVSQVKDPLGVGSNEVVAVTELRSPVRVNDQYTQYERSDVQTGIDIDGDGKADVADVAIYARVIGNESVELPELARSVTAVKVETTALVRMKRSSSGATQPVTTLVQTQWYAAGVGVVRRSLSAVSTTGSVGPLAYDELLFSWDGVTQGLGSQGPTPAWVPSSPSLLLLPDTLAATTLGDRALVLAGSLQASDRGALTFGVFDKRGVLQSTRQIPGLGDARYDFGSLGLFGIDSNAALLVMPVGPGPGRLMLQRVDAGGALLGSSSAVTLATNSGSVPLAWDGQALWIAWLSVGSQLVDSGKLMLQPFTPDGQSLAAAQVLDIPTVGGQIGSMGLSAAAGRLLVSWARSEGSTVSYRYALVRGSTGAADVHTLGTVQRSAAGPQPAVQPVLGSGIAALQWNGPVFSTTGSGPLPDTLPRGIVLDGNSNPLRSNSGSLDEERLPASWVGSDAPVLARALGERLVVTSFAFLRAAPQLTSPSDFVLTAFVRPGSSPLATAAASATGLAAASGTLTNFDQFGLPAFVLLWEDRALIIGNNSGRTMTQLFWLR
jgi:hypothetical protein